MTRRHADGTGEIDVSEIVPGSERTVFWMTRARERQTPATAEIDCSPTDPVLGLSSAGSGHVGRGINPGTPVVTTELNRMFVVMWSRISVMASSGSG
jgi:hypothetical protein